MKNPFNPKTIAPWFLERMGPHNQKPVLKRNAIVGAIAIFVLIISVGVSLVDSRKKKEKEASFTAQPLQNSELVNATQVSPKSLGKRVIKREAPQLLRQEVPRTSVDSIPMGTKIPVTLLNNVVSLDTETPVIVSVTEDVLSEGSLFIPLDSKAYGIARLNTGSERLFIKFSTLVLPDGQELPLSASAMDMDMVFGLGGDFESKEVDKTVASTAGQFISGLASGLKDKTPTPSGAPMEPGSLKNGILNAFTQSGMGYAEKRAKDASGIQPVMRIPAGKQFYLFLERKLDGK